MPVGDSAGPCATADTGDTVGRAVGDRTGDGATAGTGDAVRRAVGDDGGGSGVGATGEGELEQPHSTVILREEVADVPSPSPEGKRHKPSKGTRPEHNRIIGTSSSWECVKPHHHRDTLVYSGLTNFFL